MGALDDDLLQDADVVEPLEVARLGPLGVLLAVREVARVLVLVLDREDGEDRDSAFGARQLDEARHEMDAFEHERPALLERALRRRAHADVDVARLRHEAELERVVGVGERIPASKLEWWIAGMKSSEKNARIVWRMKSVDVTRVIPKRYASSVATVDLPVPVAPPMKTMIGRSSSRSSW